MPIPSSQLVLSHIQSQRLEQLLLDMIDIYSPSLGEEALLSYLCERLDRHQLSYTRQPVEGVYNLLITLGKGEPDLVLLGHVDTIPCYHMETHKASKEGDLVRGLGASDMKSGVAAMFEAFVALHEAGYPDDAPAIGLVLLVDEETTGLGSAHWIKEHKPRMAVIGEPTKLRLCTSHYGYGELHMKAKGKRVHSAIPEKGRNAILTLMDMVQQIYQLSPPAIEHDDSALDAEEWHYAPNLRSLHGDNEDFTVPDQCEAYVDVHLSPGASLRDAMARIDAMIKAHNERSPESPVTHEWEMVFSGDRLERDATLSQVLMEAATLADLPVNWSTFRSHSDANILAQHKVQTVIVGPGALETAHTAQEVVSTKELLQAARFYASLLIAYANQST